MKTLNLGEIRHRVQNTAFRERRVEDAAGVLVVGLSQQSCSARVL